MRSVIWKAAGRNPTLDGAQHRLRLLASDAALDQHASNAVRPVIELRVARHARFRDDGGPIRLRIGHAPAALQPASIRGGAAL